jgi:DNA-binding transcriptional regulator YhcF (GntR family)
LIYEALSYLSCILNFCKVKSARHIADKLRLMIATKQFQVGETLPSTRDLGQQLGVSFHTVRKAYQMLVTDGLLGTGNGRGFIVQRQTAIESKEERLELAAERVRIVLEELIGYGLEEEEIETIFEEQLSFAEWPARLERTLVLAETSELSQMLALALKRQVGIRCNWAGPEGTGKAAGYDAVFTPLARLAQLQREVGEMLTVPLVYNIDTDVLMSIMERLPSAQIGLVTSDEKSVNRLLEQLRHNLQFEGAILAGATYGKSLPLLVRETDVVLYTPAAAAMVERGLPERKRIRLEYALSDRTVAQVRDRLWED